MGLVELIGQAVFAFVASRISLPPDTQRQTRPHPAGHPPTLPAARVRTLPETTIPFNLSIAVNEGTDGPLKILRELRSACTR